MLHGYKHKGVDLGDFPNYHLDRLISIGLFENHNRLGGDIVLSGGDSSVGQEANKDVDVTEIGVIYSKYGLEVSFWFRINADVRWKCGWRKDKNLANFSSKPNQLLFQGVKK